MGKHTEGLGVQTTVGEIIIKLFPKGFLIDAYQAREALRASIVIDQSTGDIDKIDVDAISPFYDNLNLNESTIRKKVNNLARGCWNKLNPSEEDDWISYNFLNQSDLNRQKKENFEKEYLAPPFTPFDLFAICGVLLRDSGAYHHVVAETKRKGDDITTGRSIVSKEQDRLKLIEIGDQWRLSENGRDAFDESGSSLSFQGLPIEVIENWSILIASWNLPIFQPTPRIENSFPEWWRAAFNLLCIADRAARDSGVVEPERINAKKYGYESIEKGGFWASLASYVLSENYELKIEKVFEDFCKKKNIDTYKSVEWGQRNINTLSAANRDVVCVLPKMRTSQVGCTLRSLSHSLSLLPARGFIRASWASQYLGYADITKIERRPFNVLVVPFPFTISAKQFNPISSFAKDQRTGEFEFITDSKYKVVNELRGLIKKAREQVENIHAVVFPELSLNSKQFYLVFKYLRCHTNIELLCAGLNQCIPISKFEENEKKSNIHTATNEAIMVSFERLSDTIKVGRRGICRRYKITGHQKHHRWRLTRQQIIDYGLSSSLDPAFMWWEDLKIRNRKLPFMLMRDKWAVATLICEDLARVDPAQQVVRAVGPNLILSLVMDGPQIAERWSARYANVLSDDPGSSVLTVNSAGLIKRSLEVRLRNGIKGDDVENLVIALWSDDNSQSTPIIMGAHDKAVCLTIFEKDVDEFTMDGRRNSFNSISLRLANHFSVSI